MLIEVVDKCMHVLLIMSEKAHPDRKYLNAIL